MRSWLADLRPVRCVFFPFLALLIFLLLPAQARSLEVPPQVLAHRQMCLHGQDPSKIGAQEFAALQLKDLACNKDSSRPGNLTLDSFTIPYMLPSFPLELMASELGSFPLFVNLTISAGKTYRRLRFKPDATESTDLIATDLTRWSREVPAIARSQEVLITALREELKQVRAENQQLSAGLTSGLYQEAKKRFRAWIEPLGFPYSANKALGLPENEIWSYSANKVFAIGPNVTGEFVNSENIKSTVPYNSSLAGFAAFFHGEHEVWVRRVHEPGKRSTRVQVKLEVGSGSGLSVGIGGSALDNDVIGSLFMESTFPILAQSVMGLAALQMIPIKRSWLWSKAESKTLVYEFDLSDEIARVSYEQAVRGNFFDADRVEQDFRKAGTVGTVRRILDFKIHETKQVNSATRRLPLVVRQRRDCHRQRMDSELEREATGAISKHPAQDGDLEKIWMRHLRTSIGCTDVSRGLLYNYLYGRRSLNFTYYVDYATRSQGKSRRSHFVFNPANEEIDFRITGVGHIFDEKMNGPDLSVYSQQLQKLSPDSRFVSWSQRPTHQLPPGEMYSGVEPAHEYGPMEAVYNFQLTKDQVYRFLNTSDQRKQQIIDRVFKDYLDEVRGALPESQQSKTFGELIPVIQTNRVFDGILKLALSSVSNCDSCDASKAIMNLYFGWQALSVSAQAADSEAKFVEVMNQFDKTFSVPHFGYEYARVLMMAVTDQPWVDGPHGLAYHLEVSNQKLLGTKPLLKSSEQRTEEGELLPKQFTVNLVSSYGRYQDQAYFYGEVPFLKSSQLGVNDAAKVFSGREGIETYSCECFYSDEDPRSLKPFGFVEGHFIASGSEESKVNRLLGVCKTAAERRDLVQEGKKQLAPVAYVSVPRKSCRKDSWKVSAAERTQLRATFLELKTELAKKAAQQCRHNYLFSSMPNWFRLSLATLLGGYGWRVRGGLVDLGGTTTNRLTGMGFLAAAAYVSSNNSETFFDGLSAAVLYYPGMVPGWGAYMDMGAQRHNVLTHDLPGMIARGGMIAGLPSGYLTNRGYRYPPEDNTDLLGYIYLGSQIAARADGGYKDFSFDRGPFKALGISEFTEMAEFLTGAVIGFTLSTSLLEGPSNKSCLEGIRQ